MNLDEYKPVGTHQIALYVNGNMMTYFNSFGVEDIPKEILKTIGNKSTTTNFENTSIQAYD